MSAPPKRMKVKVKRKQKDPLDVLQESFANFDTEVSGVEGALQLVSPTAPQPVHSPHRGHCAVAFCSSGRGAVACPERTRYLRGGTCAFFFFRKAGHRVPSPQSPHTLSLTRYPLPLSQVVEAWTVVDVVENFLSPLGKCHWLRARLHAAILPPPGVCVTVLEEELDSSCATSHSGPFLLM